MTGSGVERKLRLDRAMIEEVGLASMSVFEQNLFLRYCYHVLELRVGMVIAHGLLPSQLEEFERLIDGDISFAEAVLDFFREGWRTSSDFEADLDRALENEGLSIREALCQAAALAWLEDARPDFREVVRAEFNDLKEDIQRSAAQILDAAS